RPPRCSPAWRSPAERCSAGTTPKTRVVTPHKAREKRRTGGATRASSRRGNVPAARRWTGGTTAEASPRAKPPPPAQSAAPYARPREEERGPAAREVGDDARRGGRARLRDRGPPHAGAGPRGRQARHVGAGDEQHEADGRQQHPQRPPGVAHQAVREPRGLKLE